MALTIIVFNNYEIHECKNCMRVFSITIMEDKSKLKIWQKYFHYLSNKNLDLNKQTSGNH